MAVGGGGEAGGVGKSCSMPREWREGSGLLIYRLQQVCQIGTSRAREVRRRVGNIHRNHRRNFDTVLTLVALAGSGIGAREEER